MMQNKDSHNFISLLPKNMDEVIKDAIYKKYVQIEQKFSEDDLLQLNLREILKDIFESNIQSMYIINAFQLKGHRRRIFIAMFYTFVRSVIVRNNSSLNYISNDRSVYDLNILRSLFKILKRTQKYLTLCELISLIAYFLQRKPSFMIEQTFINHLINQINEDVEEQNLTLLMVLKMTEQFKHNFKLLSQIQTLIPLLVRNLISRKYERQPYNIGYVIDIFLNVDESVDELMKMHQLEIVRFVDFIVSSTHSPLIDDIAHCVIIKMVCNYDLVKIILEKGHLDKISSDLHTSQISRYIDFICRISSNQLFAEIFSSSIAFKKILCTKQAIQLFIQDSQINNGCNILQIMSQMLNLHTNTITRVLIQSRLHDFLSILLFKQDYGMQEMGLRCLASLIKERRRIKDNCDEYQDEKYSYFRSQTLQDLIDKALNFQYINNNSEMEMYLDQIREAK